MRVTIILPLPFMLAPWSLSSLGSFPLPFMSFPRRRESIPLSLRTFEENAAIPESRGGTFFFWKMGTGYFLIIHIICLHFNKILLLHIFLVFHDFFIAKLFFPFLWWVVGAYCNTPIESGETFFFCIPTPLYVIPASLFVIPAKAGIHPSVIASFLRKRGNPVILGDILLLENGDWLLFDFKRCLSLFSKTCPPFTNKIKLSQKR